MPSIDFQTKWFPCKSKFTSLRSAFGLTPLAQMNFIHFRVCDLRKSSLLEAHVRMVIIKKETTDEGESVPYQMSDLTVSTEMEGENDRLLILWPVTIAHKIDEDSPLYDMNPRDILSSQFEVIVTLEGVTEETGNTIQVQRQNQSIFLHFAIFVEYSCKSGKKRACCHLLARE